MWARHAACLRCPPSTILFPKRRPGVVRQHGRRRFASSFLECEETQRDRQRSSSLNADPRNAYKNPTHVYSALSPSSLTGEFMDYVRGWAWQQLLLNRRLDARRRLDGEDAPWDPDDPDIVMLLEHQHVYTLGRGADERHLTFLCDDKPDDPRRREEDRRRLARTARGPGSARLSLDRRHGHVPADGTALEVAVENLCLGACPVLAPNGAPIYRVERGGECTYHGPGQLVVYPMLDLKRQVKADLHNYLRKLEEVLIQTLGVYGISGVRDDVNTGVWVGQRKIAAVGVSSSRWITTHGFALNIGPDLGYFDTSVILPCGIDGRGVTSIREILMERHELVPAVQDVARVALDQLTRAFDLNVVKTREISLMNV
jgi:lipoyl(octanoyl) transferase